MNNWGVGPTGSNFYYLTVDGSNLLVTSHNGTSADGYVAEFPLSQVAGTTGLDFAGTPANNLVPGAYGIITDANGNVFVIDTNGNITGGDDAIQEISTPGTTPTLTSFVADAGTNAYNGLAIVPEPASVGMILLGVTGMALRRRRSTDASLNATRPGTLKLGVIGLPTSRRFFAAAERPRCQRRLPEE